MSMWLNQRRRSPQESLPMFAPQLRRGCARLTCTCTLSRMRVLKCCPSHLRYFFLSCAYVSPLIGDCAQRLYASVRIYGGVGTLETGKTIYRELDIEMSDLFYAISTCWAAPSRNIDVVVHRSKTVTRPRRGDVRSSIYVGPYIVRGIENRDIAKISCEYKA